MSLLSVPIKDRTQCYALLHYDGQHGTLAVQVKRYKRIRSHVVLNFFFRFERQEQIMPNNMETEHKHIIKNWKLSLICYIDSNAKSSLCNAYLAWYISWIKVWHWNLSHHRAINIFCTCAVCKINEYSWYKTLSDHSFIFRVFKA